MACFSFVFSRFLRRLYRLRCRYHKPSVGIWSTANRIFLKIISKLIRNQRNAEEIAVFRAVNSPVAGSLRAPFRDFREDYSAEILTAHPTAWRAYVFVAVIWQIWLSSSQTR